jgi:hypothetical protein
MKIEQLNIIQYQLRVNLLPVKETGLGYHINKNLVTIDRAIKSHNEVLKGIQDSHMFKKENEEPILFKLDSKGIVLLDKNGSPIELSKEEIQGGMIPSTSLVNFRSKEYISDYENWENGEISIELMKFPEEKVEECKKSNKFDGIDISALIGVLMD